MVCNALITIITQIISQNIIQLPNWQFKWLISNHTYVGGEVHFAVTGGTGSFTGVSGVVSPGIYPFTMDPPDDVADTPFPDFIYPLPGNRDMFLSITYDINLTCHGETTKAPKKSPKEEPKSKKVKAPKVKKVKNAKRA